jgi:hypothetical protein
MLDEILQNKRIGRYIPIIGWVRSYQRAWLRDDLVSSVVAGVQSIKRERIADVWDTVREYDLRGRQNR